MSVRHANVALGVLATGSAVPGPPVSNEDVARFVGRLANRNIAEFVSMLAGELGVESRHFCRDFRANNELARPGDSNPELSARAVQNALDAAGMRVDQIDLLIGHTTTPHTLLPPNISWVADHLGFGGHYMELRQACTGFANALMIAGSMLQTGAVDTVAIVGAETGSVFFDMDSALRDRSQLVTAAQMGDGAGAVILARPHDAPLGRIEHIYFGNAGYNKASAFSLVTGGSSQPFGVEAGQPRGFRNAYNLARESGLDLFRRGFDTLRELGVAPEQVKLYLPHQANGRMGTLLAPLLEIEEQRFHNSAGRVGNTGSAATWIGLDMIRRERGLIPGDVVGVLGAEATKFLYGGFSYTEGAPVATRAAPADLLAERAKVLVS